MLSGWKLYNKIKNIGFLIWLQKIPLIFTDEGVKEWAQGYCNLRIAKYVYNWDKYRLTPSLVSLSLLTWVEIFEWNPTQPHIICFLIFAGLGVIGPVLFQPYLTLPGAIVVLLVCFGCGFFTSGYCLYIGYNDWSPKFNQILLLGGINYGLPSPTIQLSVLIDQYNLVYLNLVYGISIAATLFSYRYMRNEPHGGLFLGLLGGFVGGMVLLVMASNIPTLLLGWEFIGIFSYLLINFWTYRIYTFKSAFKAFTFNKVSDCSLVLVLVVCLSYDLPLSLNQLQDWLLITEYSLSQTQLTIPTAIVSGITVSSFCKSAQFGFHCWLPDSMEAPAPASALIHSATLVSAGVYFMGRFGEVYAVFPELTSVLGCWSLWTAVYGGVVSGVQFDLKRLLAYSTISHCGFLCFLASANTPQTLLHLYLVVHGWLKSASFIFGGYFLGWGNGYQDLRLLNLHPVLRSWAGLGLFTSVLSLGGLPFGLGFISKTLITPFFGHLGSTNFIIVVMLLSVFTGLLYSTRVYKTLFNRGVIFEASRSRTVGVKPTTQKCSSYESSVFSTVLCLTLLTGFGYVILYIIAQLYCSGSGEFISNWYQTPGQVIWVYCYSLAVVVGFMSCMGTNPCFFLMYFICIAVAGL